MKAIKLLALTLVIVLVACVFVSCNRQEKAYEEAKLALSTYLANIYVDEYPLKEGTIVVIEKSGKWYSFILENFMLVDGEIYNTAPNTFEGLVLETNEVFLDCIPENVSIYIPKP